MTTYETLKETFGVAQGPDLWAETKHWWFVIADEIYWNRDFEVPEEWQFEPSPLGPQNEEDDFVTHVVQEASDEDLMDFGALIHRYARLLDYMGLSY